MSGASVVARLTMVAIALLFVGSVVVARTTRSTALWRVVHSICVPNKRITGLATPCSAVDRQRGIAVVKDFGGPTGYLLVPTRRITGVEDPQLLDERTPNYWEDAWAIRRFVERRARRSLPRDWIAMAVNAPEGRTQDQLHIHVDCVKPEVARALRALADAPPGTWGEVVLLGHAYAALGITEADLHARSPFRIVADHGGDPRPIADQTIALVGATLAGDRPGFLLLAAPTTAANNGHGEELVDHRCALLRQPGPGAAP